MKLFKKTIIIVKMGKIKNLTAQQIEKEFKKCEFQYRINEKLICHILNIKKLTKARLLKIAKEMRAKKITSLSRDEQKYSPALNLWLCRNIHLVYDYLLNAKFEIFLFNFPLENGQKYITKNYSYFDEIVPRSKEVNLENKIIDRQNDEFHLQRKENQNKINEVNFQLENLDSFSFEFIQEFKIENIFNLPQNK
jgi:hypothetical protein